MKPIQDALCGLIYADDALILDVSAHMRWVAEEPMDAGLPEALRQAIEWRRDCVYVALSQSRRLAEELT